VADLKSELGGNLEDVTVAVMEPCELFDAKCLRKAMKVSVCVCVCVCVCRLTRCIGKWTDSLFRLVSFAHMHLTRHLSMDFHHGHFSFAPPLGLLSFSTIGTGNLPSFPNPLWLAILLMMWSSHCLPFLLIWEVLVFSTLVQF